VALKGIKGVDRVDVSLQKGEAVVTFAPGNTVRYEDLLRAIEKNGFVVKGSKLIADGHLSAAEEFTVSGSNERFRLEPASGTVAPITIANRDAEVTGSVAEVGKGRSPDVLRYVQVALR